MAEDINSNGAEPVYGPAATGPAATTHDTPAYSQQASHDPRAQRGPVAPPPSDAQAPPYTAPYPPYPSDLPATFGIAPNVAAGLAYFTVIPAVIFLLLEPYRTHPLVRFHSWQSIFLLLAAAAAKAVITVTAALLPVLLVILLSSLLSLLLFAAWLVAVVQAFSGKPFQLPVIGPFAAKAAA